MVKAAARPLVGILASVAALLCVAQLWAYDHWLHDDGDRCDFPGECLDSVYPTAFAVLEWLWLAGVVVAWLALIGSVLLGGTRDSQLRLGVAAALVFASLFPTPVDDGRDAQGLVNGGQPLGDVSAWLPGATLLLAALVFYGWELFVRRAPAGRRSRHAAPPEQEARRLSLGRSAPG